MVNSNFQFPYLIIITVPSCPWNQVLFTRVAIFDHLSLLKFKAVRIFRNRSFLIFHGGRRKTVVTVNLSNEEEEEVNLPSGELLGAGEREVGVGRLFHHEPGERNRVLHGGDTRNGAASPPWSVHNACLHLYCSFLRQSGSTARVENRIGFQFTYLCINHQSV